MSPGGRRAPESDCRLLILGGPRAALREVIIARCPGLAVETRRLSDADVGDAAERADIILGWTIPPEAARRARRLRWVQCLGAGVDRLVAVPELPADVVISRVGRGFGPAMAEHVLGYLLALALEVPRALDQQHRRAWEPYSAPLLRGRTAVVVGLGEIGGEVARLLRAAGLRVLGVNRGGAPSPHADETWPVAALDRLLPRAEILVLVVPLTAETRHLLDARRLALLPRGAWLVNVGRGALVDEPALVAALRAGQVGRAALDVFEVEPLPADSPLWDLPGVVITPHVAGPDDVAHVADVFAANYARFRAGQPLLYRVDRACGY
ncbi:MAG TPA: D-2-hydroxyacid dehydrogenase [Chloroflexota bacterium]|nr:D-2-hydroxyacid dehydrogenase [Chloroflexota bacterium]